MDMISIVPFRCSFSSSHSGLLFAPSPLSFLLSLHQLSSAFGTAFHLILPVVVLLFLKWGSPVCLLGTLVLVLMISILNNLPPSLNFQRPFSGVMQESGIEV